MAQVVYRLRKKVAEEPENQKNDEKVEETEEVKDLENFEVEIVAKQDE